jgi:hypothetical protein
MLVLLLRAAYGVAGTPDNNTRRILAAFLAVARVQVLLMVVAVVATPVAAGGAAAGVVAAAAAAGVSPPPPFYTVGCPNRGCDGGQTFHIRGPDSASMRLPAEAPALAWTWRPPHSSSSKAAAAAALPQCTAAQSGGIVCTGNLTGGMGGVVSLAAQNGRQQWLGTTLDATRSSAVLSTTGDAITTDGRALVGIDSSGRPLGPPIPLFMPPLYSLQLTLESIIPLAPRYGSSCAPQCGSLVTWLSDGVPHASTSLNDSTTGTPYNAAGEVLISMNQTTASTTRIYVQAALIRVAQQGSPHASPSQLISCRLVAEDVASTMNDRLIQVWIFEYFCAPGEWDTVGAPTPVTLLVNNTIFVCGALAEGDELSLLAIADDGPAPRLLSRTAMAPLFTSALATLSFQPQTSTLWASEVANRTRLLGLTVRDAGASVVRGAVLEVAAPVRSPVMTVAAADGRPALLFVAGNDLVAIRADASQISPATAHELWRVALPPSNSVAIVGQPLIVSLLNDTVGVVVSTDGVVVGMM